ncbi:BTAD domain-containing putative transcriptional regulator [Spongiactinospora sp. 9N601]|uniref:AfsR/SARP family transcriptional regulator n=1 Tax=Spongiactinospora sp. 9N601 TaxID=3375149 RepID=UPI00379D5EB5
MATNHRGIMKFRVLGELAIETAGDSVTLRNGKTALFMSALLLRAGRPVNLDFLIDYLWDRPPESARQNLRSYAYHIRQLMARLQGRGGCTIETVPGSYLLDLNASQLDLLKFEELIGLADRLLADRDLHGAQQELDRALSLWHGRPLEGIDAGRLVDADIAWLNERYLSAVQRRMDILVSLGRYSEAISELRLMTARYPLNEELWAKLMLALHLAGRRAEALGAYSLARNSLIDIAGIEPGRALRDVQQRILTADDAGSSISNGPIS